MTTKSTAQRGFSKKSNNHKGENTMNKTSVADIITNIIIQRLEEGTIPWQKPWTGSDAPKNLITGKSYRGINTFLLANSGFTSPYFLTFKQCQDKGGAVKAGSAGFPVVFFSMVGVEDRETGDERHIPLLRYYRVFNVEQTTLPVPATGDAEPREFSAIETAEQIVNGMQQRPDIRHGQAKAYYSPSLDYVNMPKKELFRSDEEYYSTLFHELGHSTGHASRVGRKGVMETSYFGSHEYSKEELVAEMSAAFLCSEAGIVNRTIENSAAYIQSWIKALKSKDNKGLVISAASQAQKAYDFILNQKPAELAEAA